MRDEKNKKETDYIQVRRSTWRVILCLTTIMLICTCCSLVRSFLFNQTYGDLEQLIAAVDEAYYTDVDKDAAMDGALKGYVEGLDDPYSRYMTSEEYASYQTTESGTTVGIGVTVTTTEEGYLLIKSVTENSPAEEAGFQADDVILEVDGQDIAELGYDEAILQIQGEEGTTVNLVVQRGEDTFAQTITRKSIEVVTCWGEMLENNVAYIRIESFKENTAAQFASVYETLLEAGAEAIVFDLRDDGGGLVSSLEAILDPLLPEGEIAVATYRDGTTKTLVESDATECDLPMVVLVNENTASAAELFTASLSDFGKATVVGTTTYGKGVMQVTEALSNGGALTITTATYQTTKGECYHGVGITPDKVVELCEAEVDYENPDAESDPQLAKALEILS